MRISDWSSDVCSSDLPSVNAIFEVAPNTLLRVAGYRAMSRPAPSALGAGRTFQIDADDFTSVEEAIGNVRANGSPRLKPLMSWNADAAIERSEEHTSELQSLMRISNAVYCLKQKMNTHT